MQNIDFDELHSEVMAPMQEFPFQISLYKQRGFEDLGSKDYLTGATCMV